MKFVITDDRGQKIGQPMSDRKAMRQVARSCVRAGQRVMIFLADDLGNILTYSNKDTAAISKSELPGSPAPDRAHAPRDSRDS